MWSSVSRFLLSRAPTSLHALPSSYTIIWHGLCIRPAWNRFHELGAAESFLGKPAVAQLLRLSQNCMQSEVSFPFPQNPATGPYLAPDPISLKLHCIIHPRLDLTNSLFPSGFAPDPWLHSVSLSHALYMPCQFRSPCLDHSNYLSGAVTIMRIITKQPLTTYNTRSLCASLNVGDQVPHPWQTIPTGATTRLNSPSLCKT
jgi:hypothetical protein